MTPQDLELFGNLPKDEQQLREQLEQGQLNRLFDSVFKFVVCKNEESPIFLDLANAFVFPNGEYEFKKIRLIDREKSPTRIKGKGSRLDALAILDDDQINLEVQIGYESGFKKRSLLYWSLVHSEQLNRGDLYSKIARTISVNILGFDQFKNSAGFRRSFSVRDDESGERLNDDLLIIYLELQKYLRICAQPRNKLEDWMAYFAGKGGREMEQIAEREPMIAEALDREKLFLMSEEQRLAYILDWKQMMDEADREYRLRERDAQLQERDYQLKEVDRQLQERDHQLKEADQKLTSAKYDNSIEIARRFLSNGIPPEIVARNTDLSLKEVQDLADK
ncbi:MAG: Rpn family recombination-promoting nuclease/putative transposase [Synergistaceae bacterium]|nr:Rpn family recombination-promoting nuclease/putative transposase [Synergistaceae bacterium]